MKNHIPQFSACLIENKQQPQSYACFFHWMIFICSLLFVCFAQAGVMTHGELIKRYPSPYIVGKKDTTLSVWPIHQQVSTENKLVGYVFESIDFAPIPGFSGVPINLLVGLDAKGSFLNVSVISQHEPVFLDGLGIEPVNAFVAQYKNLSLKQSIKTLTGTRESKKSNADIVELDGVTKATASVVIINQTVLASALQVARNKLGFAAGIDPSAIAQIKSNVTETHTIKELIDSGLIKHVVVSNAEIEHQFKGSLGEGLDADILAHPNDNFIDLYMAYVSVPTIGNNLLTEASWNKLQGRLDPGDQALLIMSKGAYSIIDDDFVRGSVPDRIILKQRQLPIEMRDLNLDVVVKEDAGSSLGINSVAIFKVIQQAGLDPASQLDFVLPITRLKGMVYPEKISRELVFDFKLPERFYTVPKTEIKSWQGVWVDRWIDITVLIIALIILTVALALQKKLVAKERRFVIFRNCFLLFTLCYIGWYAQGQLSIINFTSVLQALLADRSLSFFMYDPMTVTLSAFVLVTLVVWGRGTFCGWLCPFGALQELTSKAGQFLKIPQIKIHKETDSYLKWIKYFVLAGILASTFYASWLTDKLVEVEPFKTSITLNFVRSWPFVAYAIGLLIASLFVYKSFCRYLCPLGAGLAVLGRFRILDWIPRRSECGTPCQTCRYQCEYQAITPAGAIQYEECFQCMDCVVIYESDEKCAPLILEKKRARIPIDKIAMDSK